MNCRKTPSAICSIFSIALVIMLTSTISACLPQNPPPATAEITQIPELFPQSYYQQALLNDKQVLRIDSNASLITVIVRRAGLLARLGHDHVVASHDLQGWVDEIGRAHV